SANNDHVTHLVDNYVHDLLAADEADRVEEHCRSCPGCGRALEQARRRLSLLRAMPPTEASPQLVRATLDRVEAAAENTGSARPHVGGGMLVALAASALLLTGLHLYYANLKPGTIDLMLLGQRELLAATRASLRVRLTSHGGNLLHVNAPVII